MTYDVDYFIKKFEAIPENKWCMGKFKWRDRHCALGHCGISWRTSKKDNTEEADALRGLIRLLDFEIDVENVNDGTGMLGYMYQEETPKARILAVLRQIKNL